MKGKSVLFGGLVVILLLLAMVATVAGQSGRTSISWAVIRRLTVTNQADFLAGVNMNNYVISNIGAAGTDFSSTGSLTLANDLTVTDDLTAADVYAGDWLHLTASTTVAVGSGATITPLGSYQPITSTAGVTTSTSTAIADGSAAGDILILRNANASDAITVDGAGGNVECGGNVALGANDVLTLLWNGSDWSCLALRDN